MKTHKTIVSIYVTSKSIKRETEVGELVTQLNAIKWLPCWREGVRCVTVPVIEKVRKFFWGNQSFENSVNLGLILWPLCINGFWRRRCYVCKHLFHVFITLKAHTTLFNSIKIFSSSDNVKAQWTRQFWAESFRQLYLRHHERLGIAWFQIYFEVHLTMLVIKMS